MGKAQLWLVMLCVSACTAAPVSESFEVKTKNPESVQHGHTATLQCWLSPPQSAEALEVRWYRGNENFDTPVLHYQGRKLVTASQEASYAGRVSFGLKDVTSGGLKTGDVSLRLENVTIQDAGKYTCYMSSDQAYGSETVQLVVTETGSSPLLSVASTDDNKVNVSCESEGWYPQPVLRWSDQEKDLSPQVLRNDPAPSGFYSVQSWLVVPSTSRVSCTVGLENKEAKEARMNLNIPVKQGQTGEQIKDSSGSGNGWTAFGVLFAFVAIALALFGAMYISKRWGKSKTKSGDTEEHQPMIPKDAQQPTPLSEACSNYVNIKLEDNKNEFLLVNGMILRDAARNDFPDGSKVTCLTAIKGTPGFTAGKHYWEVSMHASDKVQPKASWWIGVTSAAEITQDIDFSPNTSNGFWFLSSTSDYLQFTTESSILLSVCQRPGTVGVYLNYEGGELSFYNVETKSLIGSITATFTGEVFPFFNPGKGDESPMKILHREAENQSGDVVNQTNAASEE